MNGVLKGMLLVLLIIYIVSPVDFCPGPVDDITTTYSAVTASSIGTVCRSWRASGVKARNSWSRHTMLAA